MDDNFQDIVDNLPEKPSRSRLEPHGRLIEELLRRGRTYREIAGILRGSPEIRKAVQSFRKAFL